MTSKEPKQYGLILTKKEQKPLLLSKPSVFNEDSDDSEEKSVGKSIINQGLKNLQKKQTQLEMQRALEEDPTVYEYDEVFDSMQKKKEVLKTVQIKDRKPKYIGALLQSAEQRKKDYERRVERKIQKEREAEGSEFEDKEAFVTSAYKQKMLEMQEEEERERKRNEIDAKNDVTKQDDLSSFYRHMLKEKVGENAETVAEETEKNNLVQIKEEINEKEPTVYTPVIDNLDDAARMALKRHRSKNNDTENTSLHNLTGNPNEDSDGSVDSASSSTSSEKSGSERADKKAEKRKKKNGSSNEPSNVVSSTIVKKARKTCNASNETDVVSSVEVEITAMDDKENKKNIVACAISTAERVRNLFKKRNVGDLYEAAKERYLARKAARETVKVVFNQG